MMYDEFRATVAELFPNGMVDEDCSGQLVIATGLQVSGTDPMTVAAIPGLYDEPDVINDVVVSLRANGVNAHRGSCGPTDVEIYLANDEGAILLAKDFNTTGWEAVYEADPSDGKQIPLLDGPGSNDAPAMDVVAWALVLIQDWRSNVA